MSANKVYGDRTTNLALVAEETRWDYADPQYRRGIPESFAIDQSLHSWFGASKVASDVMVQEYGRYFGMPESFRRGVAWIPQLSGPVQPARLGRGI